MFTFVNNFIAAEGSRRIHILRAPAAASAACYYLAGYQSDFTPPIASFSLKCLPT